MKTPAIYRGRLSQILSLCIQISAKKNFVTPLDIANELRITVRAAREYLSDLVRMGLMHYQGGGTYVLNREAIYPIIHKLEAVNDTQLTIDDFIPEILFNISRNGAFFKKAFRVLEKIGYSLTNADNIRNSLLKPGLAREYEDFFVGGRVLYTKSYYELESKGIVECKAVGEYSGYRLKNYLIANIIPLTVAYIASCAYIGEFDISSQPISSKIKKKPEIKYFRGKEPFKEEELLYELSVEYPELLLLGRKIAARFLKEYYRYTNCLEVINEEDDITIMVTHGSLKPHGFILATKCDTLKYLINQFESTFEKFMKEVHKRDITFVAVYESPRDHRFFEIVKEILNLKIPSMSDYAFLHTIMRDGDITAPMRVPRERGKNIEHWYEFYLKRGDYIYKFEFLTKNDPLEIQKNILTLVYPSFMISSHGPSLPMLIEAERACQYYIGWLENNFELALRYASKYVYENPLGFRALRSKEVRGLE